MSEAVEIFNDLFSQTVLEKRRPPLSDPVLLRMYRKDPKEWHNRLFEEALAMLPLAVRAVSKVPDPEIVEKVLQIINWQYAHISGEVPELSGEPLKASLELFVESFHAFTILVLYPTCQHILDEFLNSQIAKDLLRYLTQHRWWETGGHRSKAVSALICLCESVPGDYVRQLLSLASQQYKESVDRILSGEDQDLEGICEVIVALCRRANDRFVTKLIHDLESYSHKLDEYHSYILPALVKAVKLAKGRRFIAEVQ